MNQQRDMSATEGYPNRFGATAKGELSLLLGGLIICSLPRAKRIPTLVMIRQQRFQLMTIARCVQSISNVSTP